MGNNRKVKHLVLVTGLSGAGKSSALKYLEDIGFFWIDNLPLRLLVPFLNQLLRNDQDLDRIAIGVHIREPGCLAEFPQLHHDLSSVAEDFQLVFLEAGIDVLVTRYRETRRRHPLATDRVVREAIELDADYMEPMRAMADVIIDTSKMSVKQLKDRLDQLFKGESIDQMVVFMRSFGFKFGTNTDADMVLDARFLPNPFYDSKLRSLSGLDQPVQNFLERESEVEDFLERLKSMFEYLLPRFKKEKKRYLTIDIGCTGGRHRSVYIVHRLSTLLNGDDTEVQVRHRDLHRGSSSYDG